MDVFISYSRKDFRTAKILASTLEGLGFSVWWDISLRGGQSFGSEIEKQLNDASCVIVVWSEHSVRSQWVYAEATVAAENGTILPVTCDGIPSPLPFNALQNEDLREWEGRLSHSGFQSLLSAIVNKTKHGSLQTSDYEILRTMVWTKILVLGRVFLVWFIATVIGAALITLGLSPIAGIALSSLILILLQLLLVPRKNK